MKYTITGDNLQMVNVELSPGDVLYSVSGAMAYMTGSTTLEAKARDGAWASLKRSLSGASMFLVKYEGEGTVGISGDAPGKIVDLDIGEGAWMVQKHGFLAAEDTVNIEMACQKKLSTAMFGGEGLIIQKVSGTGTAFIYGCGDLVIRDLAPGEVVRVSTSKAVAWEESVKYDISTVAGLKNKLLSGEGIFVTTLTGPGRIILQSMTLGDLAMALYPFMPASSS